MLLILYLTCCLLCKRETIKTIVLTLNQINSFAKSGPSGQSIPAQVHQTADGAFKAEFVPRAVGEHRVNVTVKGMPTAGSPYAAKVLYFFKEASLNTAFPSQTVTLTNPSSL